jgi:hypothetical protein
MKKACEHMNLKSKLAHRFSEGKTTKNKYKHMFPGLPCAHRSSSIYIKSEQKMGPDKLIDMEFS